MQVRNRLACKEAFHMLVRSFPGPGTGRGLRTCVVLVVPDRKDLGGKRGRRSQCGPANNKDPGGRLPGRSRGVVHAGNEAVNEPERGRDRAQPGWDVEWLAGMAAGMGRDSHDVGLGAAEFR